MESRQSCLFANLVSHALLPFLLFFAAFNFIAAVGCLFCGLDLPFLLFQVLLWYCIGLFQRSCCCLDMTCFLEENSSTSTDASMPRTFAESMQVCTSRAPI